MRLILIFFLIFLTHIQSYSQSFVAAGLEGRVAKNSEDNHELETPPLVYFGYRWAPWAIAFEGLTYKESARPEGLYEISTKHYELTVYALRFLSFESEKIINPYFTFGIGGMREVVETKIGNVTSRDHSKLYPIGKFGLGLWSVIQDLFFVNLEGKAMLSEGLSPELMFAVSLRLGLEF